MTVPTWIVEFGPLPVVATERRVVFILATGMVVVPLLRSRSVRAHPEDKPEAPSKAPPATPVSVTFRKPLRVSVLFVGFPL